MVDQQKTLSLISSRTLSLITSDMLHPGFELKQNLSSDFVK